jgi:formate hydrogenlyase subunit 6/NADH:ubiquinone oxidoreductase subunit I
MIRDEDIIQVQPPKISAADRLYLTQIAQGIKVTLNHMIFKPRITVQYPEQKREMNTENYRGVHRLNAIRTGAWRAWRVSCARRRARRTAFTSWPTNRRGRIARSIRRSSTSTSCVASIAECARKPVRWTRSS